MSAKKSRPTSSTPTAREQRLAAARKESQSAERRRTMLLVTAGVLAVALIAGAVWWAIATTDRPETTADGELAGVQTFDYPGLKHTTETVDYAQTPPAGGEHDPAWLNCGIYEEPVRDENAVHSLEHGAVWITYRPDLPADQVETLRSVTPTTYGLLSPYEGLDAPITLSSWNKQLAVQSADDPAIKRFIADYRQGPQTPEPGAACTGGVGTPLAAG